MLGPLDRLQDFIGDNHRHTAEVRHQMLTLCMASEATLGAFLRISSAQRKQVTTMTAPVGTDIGEVVEPMRDAVVDLFLVRIRFVVCFADTLGNHFRITFGMASILAVRTLHSCRVFEKVAAQSTAHDVVKLLLDKLVSLLLVHDLFLLTNSTLSIQTDVEGTTSTGLFVESHGEMDSTRWFQRKPRINHHRLKLLTGLRKTSGRTSTRTIARRHEGGKLLLLLLMKIRT